MSERIQWLNHKGIEILYGDFSSLDEDGFLKELENLMEEFKKVNLEYNLTIINVKNTTATTKIKNKSKELTDSSKDIKSRTAIIGITGLKKIIAKAIRTDIYFAENLEDAKEFLANYATQDKSQNQTT